jgi:MFS family permease
MSNLTPGAEDDSGTHALHKPTLGVAIVCCGVTGLISLLFTALSPALPPMAAEFKAEGDGAMIAQMVFSLAAITLIFGAMAAGILNEMFGRRRVLMYGFVIYAAAGVAGMIAPNLATLALTRAVAGFVSGLMLTASYATIGEYYEGHAREHMLGLVSMFSGSCAVILTIIGGVIVDHLGWRAIFGLFALSLILVPVAQQSLHARPMKRQIVTGGWEPVITLWPLYALLCVYTILIYMTALQSPFLLDSRGIHSGTQIGVLLALTSVFGALGSFAYGYMRRYMGFSAMLAFASLAGGGGMVLAGFISGVSAYVIAAILIGSGIGIIEPTIASETLTRTPERLHDRAMGVNISAMFFGQFLNPVVMGPLRTTWGIGDAFIYVGLAFFAAGLLFVVATWRKPALAPAVSKDS